MGEDKFGLVDKNYDTAACKSTSIEYDEIKNPWTQVRSNRVYGCIECRGTLAYMGVDNKDDELFQCPTKKCSMYMKVLLIHPVMVQAKILG